MNVQPGDRVAALTAGNEWIPLMAVTAVERGHDFPVVWVCTDRDWDADEAERPKDAIPWPAEAIRGVEL